ncbi:uncharacterized protein RSE6_11949 [Rhynchosporium secalis]|uniref:CREG-like beta-barrel domain-containing protein n=1 Tax=Rhynchosporium secalis TaxID=38038 RepID=A0A1E1MPB0_RHYSE|nr:uncharacterized protein RSE6_11949 [Rhynchosporium secalis]
MFSPLTLLTLATTLPLVSVNALEQPQYIFSNPSASSETTQRIPTSYESAVLARRILHLTGIGTLATVFPTTSQSVNEEEGKDGQRINENRPEGLGGVPIGLMDYIADCEPSTGNPTILEISIATSFKNVRAGSNISLALTWVPPHTSSSTYYSAANLPRFSLLGYLEPIPTSSSSSPSVSKKDDLAKCFVDAHPDARYWLPGNRIHHSEWVRLVVTQVYWIGGFGDRAYIGWIPVEEWKNVTMEEVEGVRLPGEKEVKKGWFSEWEL